MGLIKLVTGVFAGFFILCGCTAVPQGVSAVEDFELPRYLGKWYEIARLDHSFERGLSDVSAHYELASDGGVRVTNRGRNETTGKWKEALGKAYFVDGRTTGHLKVSFFGPFYASYVVFYLDKQNYQYALVSGPDRDYLWILSRQPVLSDSIMALLVDEAKGKGFAVDELIYVKHQQVN